MAAQIPADSWAAVAAQPQTAFVLRQKLQQRWWSTPALCLLFQLFRSRRQLQQWWSPVNRQQLRRQSELQFSFGTQLKKEPRQLHAFPFSSTAEKPVPSQR